jgi:topoisomerase-4 subunit A
MKRLIIREIEADAKQYGDDRRTLIEEAQKAVAEQKVVDEPVTVIVSEKGWVRARTGIGHDRPPVHLQGRRLAVAPSSAARSTTCWHRRQRQGLFGAGGALPGARGDGVPITTLVDLSGGVRILHYFAARPTRACCWRPRPASASSPRPATWSAA